MDYIAHSISVHCAFKVYKTFLKMTFFGMLQNRILAPYYFMSKMFTEGLSNLTQIHTFQGNLKPFIYINSQKLLRNCSEIVPRI